jgi:hypothetical protein
MPPIFLYYPLQLYIKLTCILRGSIAPIIAIAWYQSTDIAEIYTTLGYLVPILSVLSMVSIST